MALQHANKPINKLTLYEDMDAFISSRSLLPSPSTIAGYKRILKNFFLDIHQYQITDLARNPDPIQSSINKCSSRHAPKTVRNAYGFLSTVFRQYAREYTLNITLPKKAKIRINLPNEKEVLALIHGAQNQDLRIAIVLASWMGLRRSEQSMFSVPLLSGRTINGIPSRQKHSQATAY